MSSLLVFKRTFEIIVVIGFLFFAYLMLQITLQYIPTRIDVAFLRIKQDVVGFLHYRIAFFLHVYSSMAILIIGFLQFLKPIRKNYPTVHKWFGTIYSFGIILIAGPSGFVMGVYGNGGWIARSSFCILAILWIFFTYKGFSCAMQHNYESHKKWMYRSYALTLSAISLRLWKWILVILFQPKPMDVYQIVAWLGWTGNLLIAETIIYFTLFNSLSSPLDLNIPHFNTINNQ